MCFTPKAEVSLCWTAQFPRPQPAAKAPKLAVQLIKTILDVLSSPSDERPSNPLSPNDFIIAAWDLNSLSAHLNPVATGDKRRDQNRIYIWTADEKGTEHDLCHWRYTRKH